MGGSDIVKRRVRVRLDELEPEEIDELEAVGAFQAAHEHDDDVVLDPADENYDGSIRFPVMRELGDRAMSTSERSERRWRQRKAEWIAAEIRRRPTTSISIIVDEAHRRFVDDGRFEQVPCRRCGQMFVAKRRGHVYCDGACRAGQPGTEVTCVVCSRSFVGTKRHRYCTDACKATARRRRRAAERDDRSGDT